MTVKIDFDQEWKDDFFKRLEQDGPWGHWDIYQLAIEAEKHLIVPDFEGLQAPVYLPNLAPLPHQLEVANQVIEKMNGKAILADEVGLGKTIEAGLIMKEYMIRGLVKKILILVPASLVSQWTHELNTKFHIPAAPYKKSYRWEQYDCVVTSLDLAKRSPHREEIYEQQYDMVIVDEAHKLKNHQTKNYAFVQQIKKKFCLLLTATPIQNRIDEIFYLVSLLKPGHLGTQSSFLEKYKKQKASLQENEHLRQLVNKVMIRNRRNETGMEWKKRRVETIVISFTESEQALYDSLNKLKNPEQQAAISMITLQREACSSKEALFYTLQKMYENENAHSRMKENIEAIVKNIEAVSVNSKANKALELIKQIDDKVIIFTEYRATQLYLQWFLRQHGIYAVPFRGGFKRGKKDWMRELFQHKAQVLIATEAGGEGINLQFCHHMINFDLPWNPMRLEQRIGRIHRLGQEHDVHIYNFAIQHTIEEHILKLLHQKIQLFERVVGELDAILTQLDFGKLEDHFDDIFNRSQSEGEMKIKMENLSAMIQFAEDVQKGGEKRAAGAYPSIS